MPNRRNPKKLEEKIARNYVYQHSISACRNNDPDEVRERVFVGTSEEVVGAVLAELKDQRTKGEEGEIPDYPQGLVISDSRGEGFFDSNSLP